MVEQPKQKQFAKSKQLTLPDIMSRARLVASAITAAPLDSIKNCARLDDQTWRVTIEVIESPARLGDNDLLTAYELTLDASGELTEFQRVGRYHREDA